MPSYSVAEARNNLSRLIRQSLAGEKVVITSHGKPTVELRAANQQTEPLTGTIEWLFTRTAARAKIGISSAQLLRQMRDEGW